MVGVMLKYGFVSNNSDYYKDIAIVHCYTLSSLQATRLNPNGSTFSFYLIYSFIFHKKLC